MILQGTIDERTSNKMIWLYFLSVKQLVCLVAFCSLTLTASVTLNAQNEETTRKLWDTAFINTGSKKTPPRKAARRTYRVATPNVPTEGVNSDTVVGVTLWRLRRANSTDSGERLIVHESADTVAPLSLA